MLLAADIGGTKTDLAIFSSEAGPHEPLTQARVHSASYPSLQAIVKEFASQVKKPIDRACFAVAGPVVGGRMKTTNLPWVIEENSLAQELNINLKSVHIINDLEAVARAVPILRLSDVRTINTGEPVPKGALGVIAPGTGLGESFLTWDGSRCVAHSSEGGHSDFAPTDSRQIRLLEYMLKKFDHVSFEHLCSGIGIPNIYAFLREVEGIPESPEVAILIASSSDPTAVIVGRALDSGGSCKLCSATIEMFFSILASEAGNLAVKVLATGGIYVTGGVAVHTRPALKKTAFMDAFRRKGRFAELMSRIPVHFVLSQAALVGAAVCGLEN